MGEVTFGAFLVYFIVGGVLAGLVVYLIARLASAAFFRSKLNYERWRKGKDGSRD